MSIGAGHRGAPVERRPRITILPTTTLGRWAVGLALAFFPLVLVGTVVPRGVVIALACGLSGGLAALVAIVRDRERSVTVFAALVPVAIPAAFVLAELISGNP